MEIIYGSNKALSISPSGVGLGNFDGLHIGHMTLINTLLSESKLNGLCSVLYTFTKHPENIMRKKLYTPLLTNSEKKIELLKETSLNTLYFDEFDEEFSRMKPEDFVKKILIGRLKMKLAVSGFNYRFGYKGQGDVALLKELGKRYGFKVIIIPPIKVYNEVASSTLIRQYITMGDMNKVFRLLGRHYSVTGAVETGRKVGRTIGFPTANIQPDDNLVLPNDGVYITKTLYQCNLLNGVTNVGYNPTFERQKHISVETHLLDFQADLYGKNIEVFFIAKVRGEKKFRDKDELIKQIQKDILKAREYFDLNGIDKV
jgi:riboflavin kinase / FMN adenylyltransferase